uniref:Putative GHKL domain containing protein n=1 Tax=viral metagenome TaxID=1070528 RepID=A0A6M3M3D7_9ZZZZ
MVELENLIRPGAGRGLDFVILDDLRKRTGISISEILKFSIAEILANALDTDVTEIYVKVKKLGEFDEVTVGDNGSKQISLKEIKLILDFGNKASSKRGFLRVSRGYLGNALKCLFGYSYALAEARKLPPPEILIRSHESEYTISLKPDRVREVINSEIVTRETEDTGFNSFTLRFPISRYWSGEPIKEYENITNIIFATSIVNPTIKFVYNLWDIEGELGEPGDTPPLRKDTSILWYEPSQFKALFYDFVRASPETKLKDLISLFRGLTAKKIQREILQALTDHNHVSYGEDGVPFFPATPIETLSSDDILRLYHEMRSRSKPISKRSVPKVLGIVGEERFEKVKEQHGWKRLRYTVMKGRWKDRQKNLKASFPFLVELAVFDREEEDDQGLQIFQCVNFMASMEDIFSRLFNVEYRLGRVGITKEAPVTLMVHLVCPVLKWLNYGKSGLYE